MKIKEKDDANGDKIGKAHEEKLINCFFFPTTNFFFLLYLSVF